MFIEAKMLPAVNGFLLDECADFLLQFGRHALAKFFDRFDEKGLAFRKSDGKSVKESGCIRVTADPAAPIDQGAGKISVAGPDMKIGGSCAFILPVGFGR